VTFNQALQLPAWQKSLQLREKLEMSQLEPDQVGVHTHWYTQNF
jgi:hypothetical protein